MAWPLPPPPQEIPSNLHGDGGGCHVQRDYTAVAASYPLLHLRSISPAVLPLNHYTAPIGGGITSGSSMARIHMIDRTGPPIYTAQYHASRPSSLRFPTLSMDSAICSVRNSPARVPVRLPAFQSKDRSVSRVPTLTYTPDR
jgi:hypothetical protein